MRPLLPSNVGCDSLNKILHRQKMPVLRGERIFLLSLYFVYLLILPFLSSLSPSLLSPFQQIPLTTQRGRIVTTSSGARLWAFRDQLYQFKHVPIPSSNFKKGIIISRTSLDYMVIKRDYGYKWLRVHCLEHGTYSRDISSGYCYYHHLKALEKQWKIFSRICKGPEATEGQRNGNGKGL